MVPEDHGFLHFFDDQWQASPTTTDGSFLSPDEVMDKDVQITFRIFLMRIHKNAEYWDDEIGTGRSIVLHYCPGDPVNIVQVRTFKFWKELFELFPTYLLKIFIPTICLLLIFFFFSSYLILSL